MSPREWFINRRQTLSSFVDVRLMSAWKAISSSDPVACNNTNQKQVKCIAQWRTNDVLLRRKVCLIEILPMRLCEEKETKEMYYIEEFVKRMRSSSSRSANSAARLISLEALVQLLAHENGPTRRPCWRMCVCTRVCCFTQTQCLPIVASPICGSSSFQLLRRFIRTKFYGPGSGDRCWRLFWRWSCFSLQFRRCEESVEASLLAIVRLPKPSVNNQRVF